MRKFKKSMGCCLLLIVLAVFQAGNVFALNDAISGAISGQLTGTTLTVTIQPDISISSGTTLSLFVVATINNAWVYLQPSGQWTQWVGPSLTNSFPAYQTFTTSKTPADPVIIKPIQNLDLSSVTGAIIYVGYGTSFNAMMSNGSCQPVAVVPTATVNSPIAYPASLAPSNWPNHIAMGAAMDTIADIPYNATVEAIYKYATGDGAPGQIVAPTVIQKLIDDAGTLSKLQMSHQNNYYSVRPVLVEYTANGSQSLAILQADFTRDKMAMHFINLMKDCNAIGAKNSTNASIVLNPDLLGEIEQQLFTNAGAANQTNPNFIANVINGANANINATQLLSGCASNCSLPINEALKIAVYFINNYPDSTSQTDFATATANYTDVTQAKVNNNSATVSLPSVTQDFAGYIRSINWTVKNYAPKATFGWHSNIRAAYDVPWNGIYDGLWAHTMPDNTAITAYASVISTFWKNLGVFSGDWKPDFIVFDKYGINGLSSYVSTFSNGYLFNQQDMNSYFAFVKAITSTLWVPAMLWQIPGGHVGADITNTSTMSTEAQYLFGDKNFSTVNIPTDKLSAYYRSYSGNDLDAGKFLTTTCGASPCDWSIPHLATAANANVFAVLWGTGTRSTSIGAYPGGDQLDGGWLMNKVNAYYNVPFFTDGATTPTVLSSLKLSARFIGTMPADLADELDQEFIKASTDSNAPLIISGVDVSTLSEAERSAIKTIFDYDIPITLVRPTCAQREALYSLVELPGTDLTDDIYEFWGLQTSRKFEIWEYAFASPAARQVTVTDIITCQEDGTILITHGPLITDDLKDVHDYQLSRVAGLREWLVLAPDRANSQTAVGTDSSTLAVESAAQDGPKATLEQVVLADYVSAPFSYLNNQYAVTLESRSVYQSPFNYFVISARGLMDAFSEWKATTSEEERAYITRMLPNAYGILNTGRIATKYDIGFHVPDPGAGELVEVSTVLPVSDTKSEEITNTLAWSLGGKVTGGIECEITAKDKGTEAGCKAKLGAELSFGVTTSESHKFTKKDVEIANNSASNSLSWSFNILPPKLFFEGIMQLHSWYAPAILARSTFQPEMTWVWRVSDTYRQRYKDGLPVVVEFTPKLFHAYRRYSFPWWQANEVYLGPEKPFTMQVTLPWPPTTATVKK